MSVKNYNIRFRDEKEKDRKAWDHLHSKEIRDFFKLQNGFVIDAINDYYDRHICIKKDPYLETRRKMGNTYAYVRVSSRDQNEDRQFIAMKEMGVPDENIFIDKQSGKDFNRPQYKKLIRKLKKDDLLYIKSIDRLGRNYTEIIEQWKIITKDKGADICVLDMNLLDTRRNKDLLGTFISDLVLGIFNYVAENERTNIHQRQAEGIVAARIRGVRFGRPPLPLPENFHDVYQRWKRKLIPVQETARECGMPRSAFFDKAKRNDLPMVLQ